MFASWWQWWCAGRAVRESGIPREQIFVTTKVWNSDQGYQNTLRAFDRSLNELGLGYGTRRHSYFCRI